MLSEEKEILGYLKEAFKLREQKVYKQAVEMLYKALDMDNDNIEVLYQLGEVYSLMHNSERALGYLEQVLSIQPEHIESLKLMEKIYSKENYYSEAFNIAKKIFNAEQNSENLKELVILAGKLKLAERITEYAKSEFCNSDVIYEIALALYKSGKTNDAKKLLEKHFDNEKAQILLGKIYFDEGDLEKSREIFDKMPKTTDNPELLNYQGLFALEDMDFVSAIKCFSKASSINKSNSTYFYNLGNAYFFNGWMEEAQKAYSKAIYLAPDNMDYRYSLSYLYYVTNKFDKSQKELDAILGSEPNHPQAKVVQALLMFNKKDYVKAKELLESNIKNGIEDSFTLTSLAKVYSALDMFEQAEETINKVIVLNPKNIDYISELADIYIKEKKYDKALELADKNISTNPNYVYGYVIGARAAYKNSDMKKTKEYAQEALSLDMNCSDGYYYLALVRFNEKDYDEAVECMKRAITYNPLNPVYYAEMSNIYKAKNDLKTALEYVSEATDIDNSVEYKLMYQELVKLNRKK